jgi:hypothetical protein
MKPGIIILPILLFLAPALAVADKSPIAEAMSRGLIGKAPLASNRRKATAAQWRREQLAAVDKAEQIMRRAQKQPGLLAQYALMRASYEADDERVFRQIFGQYLSWFQTWIGDYDGARKSFSIAQTVQADDARSPLEGNFRVAAAEEVILRLASDRKAIFFNEAHSAPLTRTLTLQLLASLRAQGFTHFAAETLYPARADLLKRGYPAEASGFYINEPIYGEMVRAALRLGYQVIAYDAEDSTGDAREKGGAQALYDQVFKHDPKARLVVNAGFSHIQKSGRYLDGSSMAEFFQQISGIEPLAIEQTMLIEHALSNQDHPHYRAAMQTQHPGGPFVFVNAAGKAWTLKPGQYDVSVFFPPETLAENRPEWASIGGARQPYPVAGDDCRGHLPCLIQAHYDNEGEDSVAADRVVLGVVAASIPMSEQVPADNGGVHSRLYLYPGSYRLTAVDRDGQILATRKISVGAATTNAHEITTDP